MTPLLLKHLRGESIGRFPVWMMRQAGRYLPTYRAIREKHTFWEMVTKPDVATEVSLLPLEVLPVDAVIFFSDILTLPYGFGIEVKMQESIGPVVTSPLKTAEAFARFAEFDPAEHTAFVGKALQNIRERIPGEMALLGFAGAPWTVGSYLIEGKGKTHFESIKGWMHRDPEGLTTALSTLGDATLKYLRYQVKNGAHAVQLFDTWLGEMPRDFFVDYYRPVLNQIFSALAQDNIPAIYFAKRSQHLYADFQELNVPILSVDELQTLTAVDRLTGSKFSLQGNLDPLVLFGDEGTVRRKTRELVQTARELPKPAIMNLGHGIMPGVPVANAKAFIEEARALWI